MQRLDWHELYIQWCFILKERSTCRRLKTACIITKNNRPISNGYNGVSSSRIHCEDYWKNTDDETFNQSHHEWSVINEYHAEMNAIAFACKEGISLQECTLYTILSPCIDCARNISNVGIKQVYYVQDYDRDIRGIHFLTREGVEIIKLNLSK